MATKKAKKMTEEQKRKARNEYSRKWKAAHKDKVRKWNSAWLKAQGKGKKKAHRSAKKASRVKTLTGRGARVHIQKPKTTTPVQPAPEAQVA